MEFPQHIYAAKGYPVRVLMRNYRHPDMGTSVREAPSGRRRIAAKDFVDGLSYVRAP
jgi:hypothetical protein